jgi:predicted secreted protein
MHAKQDGDRRHSTGLPGFAMTPAIAPEAPDTDRVTEYDAAHFIDYARMLDAESANQDWREAAVTILRLDLAGDEAGARRCWDSHLERAHWIVTEGYAQLLAEAGVARRSKAKPVPSSTSE